MGTESDIIRHRYANHQLVEGFLRKLFGGRTFSLKVLESEIEISGPRKLTAEEKEQLYKQLEVSRYAHDDAPIRQENDEIQQYRPSSPTRSNMTPDPSISAKPLTDAERNTSMVLNPLNPKLSAFQTVTIPMKNEKIDLSSAKNIASGAFSDVYKLEVAIVSGSTNQSTRNIAIKRLKSISNARSLFQAESKALLRLAKTTEPTASIIYLLADPFEGKRDLALFFPLAHSNLESYLANDGISDKLTPAIWKQFSSLTVALSTIHGENIVHGDLKPDNILVFKSETAVSLKIAGFGHSVCDGTTGSLAANATAYSLNPSYSAPEVWRSTTDLRLYDVWALGCIFLEVAILMRDGAEEVKRFRSNLMSPIGRITASTFHDGYRLKPHVSQYLDNLSIDPIFRQLSSSVRGMLREDTNLRLTASLAADALRDFDGISQKLYLPLRNPARRAGIMLENSDVSLNQLLMFFLLPILCGFFISAIAVSSSLRLAIYLPISNPTFWVLIVCTTYYWAGTPSPRSLYSRLRVWLSLDDECPFPDCPSHAAGIKLPYPDEWYRHVINEHGNNTSNISRSIASNASQSISQGAAQNVALGTTALLHTQPLSTQRPSGSGPPYGNTSNREDNQNLYTRKVLDQELDLCFPEFPVDTLHQWKALEFNSSWSDEVLFQELARAYYDDALRAMRLLGYKNIQALISIVSFTQLSRIRPRIFFLVSDHLQRNKACLENAPQDVGRFLLAPSSQRLLANRVRIAWRRQATNKDNLGAQIDNNPFVVGQLTAFARKKQPPPGQGYEGKALEFVESLNKRKLCLQFIIAVAVSIIAGTVAGTRSGSMERAFAVIGLGVSLSQLIAAVLVLVIPPPHN